VRQHGGTKSDEQERPIKFTDYNLIGLLS
jgi:hypothetical protein